MNPATARSRIGHTGVVRPTTGILFGFVLSFGAQAEPLAVRPGQPPTKLRDFVEYLEDPASTLRLEDIAKPRLGARFRAVQPGREINFGNTLSTYWFRFSLANPGAEEIALLLEVGFPQLDQVELYQPLPGGGFRSDLLGDTIPFSQRRLLIRDFVFPLSVPAAATQTYYLRARTGGTLFVPLEISAVVPYLEESHRVQLMLGLFYGIFLGTALYNLFLFFSVRQVIYFYLVGHTLSMGLVFACLDGLAFRLWPTATAWHQWAIFVFIAQITLFTLLFVRRFVDTAAAYPRLDRLLKRALWLFVTSNVLVAFLGVRAFFRMNLLWLITIGVVLAIAVLWHARRHRPARIYAVAWGFLLLTMVLTAAGGLGLIPLFFDAVTLTRWAASAEVLLAAIAVAANLAETRRALAASEEKLTRAFQSSPDVITITTIAEGRFLEINEGFEKVSGYTREETIGRTVGELGIWEIGERERVLATLERRGRVEELGTHIVCKSGKRCPIRYSAAAIKVEGRPCLVAVAHDMTQLKQAAEERESLIRRLEAQNAELERFTYTVSHDLKAPLITIGGFLGFLEQQALAGNARDVSHYVERIRAASQRMYQLLDELLELSRIGRVVNPAEEVPLGELAKEAAEVLSERMREAGVDLDVSPGLPVVRGDRTRLLEVFQNLLENALRFSGDQAEPRIEIGCRRDDEVIVCYVRDNGIGIEPRYHDKIFGLFERLDARTEGTGIGLALVKRIIEFHGGRIWVESEGNGKGARFCFSMPSESPPAGVTDPAR